MKARVQQTGPYNGYPYRLTISIIVKDSESTLRRCLESLQPLRDIIPNELIITDTGSTDGTVAIAEEFADRVLHFEWCDDFSAARNLGLSEARGEWFLYVDSDEWFGDYQDLLHFLSTHECDSYGSAAYIQRNYQENVNIPYVDASVVRIHRNKPGLHFEGLVHESVTPCPSPIKNLNSFVHHYGYYGEQAAQNKNSRNIPLLIRQIQEENGEKLRFIYQLAQEYMSSEQYEEAVETIRQGLQVAFEQKKESAPHAVHMMTMLVDVETKRQDYDDALLDAGRFLQYDFLDDYSIMQLCYNRQYCACQKGLFQESAEAGKRFLEVRQRLIKDPERQLAQKWGSNAQIFHPLFRDIAIISLICSSFETEQYEDCLANMEFANLRIQNEQSDRLFPILFESSRVCDRPDAIAQCYSRVANDPVLETEFLDAAEAAMRQGGDLEDTVVRGIASATEETPYVMMQRLFLADRDGDGERIRTLFGWFLENRVECGGRCRDVLGLVMKHGGDIVPFVELLSMEDWQEFLAGMLARREENPEKLLEDYLQSHELLDTLPFLYLRNCLLERRFLRPLTEDHEENFDAFYDYVAGLIRYARRLYHPDIFTQDTLRCLPRVYQFAWHMEQALEAREKDPEAYLRSLRNAVASYPVMRAPILTLIGELETRNQKMAEQAQEFRALSDKVKRQIERLIVLGSADEARRLIAQLDELIPGDADVARYRITLDTRSTGIQNHLPQ